jgi:phage anti-repressor protein/predicted GIY-YIG superfamily endonuclease
MTSNISFRDYLKQHTEISNKFIDDFFNLYNEKTTNDDFVINLDNIVDWLKTQKKHLKKTLLESYQEHIDYKIKTLPPKGKGRPMEEIMLTPSCFKRLSMMSRTAKAEQVRDYFIKIEAHLDKYKNYIFVGLRKEIDKYKAELKPEPEVAKGGIIYILKTREDIDGVYKIGRTKDFQNRLKTHQSSHPDKLEIAYVYETENVDKVEECLKQLLKNKAYRKRKEFYEIDPDLLKDLISVCACMHMIVRKKPNQIKDSHCKYIIHISKLLSDSKTNKSIILDKL